MDWGLNLIASTCGIQYSTVAVCDLSRGECSIIDYIYSYKGTKKKKYWMPQGRGSMK